MPNNITLAIEAHPRKGVINPQKNPWQNLMKAEMYFHRWLCCGVFDLKNINKAIPLFCFLPWKQLLHEKVDRQDIPSKQRLKSCHQLRNVLENKWGPLANNLTVIYRNEKNVFLTYKYLCPTSQFDEAKDKWFNLDCFYRNMTIPQRRETECLCLHIKSKLQMKKNHHSQSKIQLKKYVWL